MRTKLALILALALPAASCTTTKESAKTGPAPADYRQIAAAYMRTSLIDPLSVIDPMIAPPKLGGSVMYPGWVICVRMNAKNRMGGYTGASDTAIITQNGRVVDALGETNYGYMMCGKAVYEPFPEMLQAIASPAIPAPAAKAPAPL